MGLRVCQNRGYIKQTVLQIQVNYENKYKYKCKYTLTLTLGVVWEVAKIGGIIRISQSCSSWRAALCAVNIWLQPMPCLLFNQKSFCETWERCTFCLVSLGRRTFICTITTTYYYWNCKTATNAINTFPPKDHSLNHKIKKQSHEIYKCTSSCTPGGSEMTDAGSRKSVLIRSQLEINSFIHCCYLTLCTLLFTFFCKGCKIKLLFYSLNITIKIKIMRISFK